MLSVLNSPNLLKMEIILKDNTILWAKCRKNKNINSCSKIWHNLGSKIISKY